MYHAKRYRTVLAGFGLVWAFSSVLLFGSTVVGCPLTAVQRQATAAEAISSVFNRSLPVWVSVFEEDGERAIAAAPTIEEGEAALRVVVARWEIVRDAWEAARTAHLVWRAEINRCRTLADAGTCTVNLRHLEDNVVTQVTNFRCSLRTIGRGWVDELPGNPTCAVADAGRD